MLEGIKALIFDLDGTLVDSMWIWSQIDIEYLGKFGIALPPDLQHRIEGKSFSETAAFFKETFNIPDPIEQIKSDWNSMAMNKYETEIPLKENALQLLQYAKEHNIKTGIATSNSIELVERVIKAHEIDDYIDVIKTSCDAKKGKPAPDIYLLVAKCLGVEPSECLVFEDIIPGIQAGLSAGMKVCAVDDDYSKDVEDKKRNLAHYYIYDFSEVFMDRKK